VTKGYMEARMVRPIVGLLWCASALLGSVGSLRAPGCLVASASSGQPGGEPASHTEMSSCRAAALKHRRPLGPRSCHKPTCPLPASACPQVVSMAGRCAERLVLGEGNVSTAGGCCLFLLPLHVPSFLRHCQCACWGRATCPPRVGAVCSLHQPTCCLG